MIALLRELAVAAGTSAARALVKLLSRKPPADEWRDVPVEPAHPSFRDLEHQRRQMNDSIAAGKRTADTVPPPPPRKRRPE